MCMVAVPFSKKKKKMKNTYLSPHPITWEKFKIRIRQRKTYFIINISSSIMSFVKPCKISLLHEDLFPIAYNPHINLCIYCM